MTNSEETWTGKEMDGTERKEIVRRRKCRISQLPRQDKEVVESFFQSDSARKNRLTARGWVILKVVEERDEIPDVAQS